MKADDAYAQALADGIVRMLDLLPEEVSKSRVLAAAWAKLERYRRSSISSMAMPVVIPPKDPKR